MSESINFTVLDDAKLLMSYNKNLIFIIRPAPTDMGIGPYGPIHISWPGGHL